MGNIFTYIRYNKESEKRELEENFLKKLTNLEEKIKDFNIIKKKSFENNEKYSDIFYKTDNEIKKYNNVFN
jgi:hypothetical protein